MEPSIFLALLATVFGTLLAIPISFFAAKNLMDDVKSPVATAALSLISWPVGIGVGLIIARWMAGVSELLIPNFVYSVIAVVVCPLLIWLIVRWALPAGEEQQPGLPIRIVRLVALLLAAALGILTSFLLGNLMFLGGEALMSVLGPFGFLGFFIAQLGEILRMITPAVAGLIGGGVASGALGKLGLLITERLPTGTVRIINIFLAALAGAILFAILGAGIEWLYQTGDPMKTLWIPVAVGAILGALLSLRYGPKDLLPTGTTIYLILRTILNALRSIEPLIYVIIFVVWVGIGPFAGALALALHTIAALAKLYSEQVESISTGPLEAVTATGANRLQTIVYAVVPQIIPPYISFTMYRWDINVRMSTIIGFAGGGGIGFLLQQNIRLLDYRAAAVQMLAIAVVVATMDYTSALIRERFV